MIGGFLLIIGEKMGSESAKKRSKNIVFLIATEPHNPEAVRFKSHPRNQKPY